MMSDSELWSKVTSEQKKLAYTIYEKWLITAKSTERINYQAATDAINASYLAIGFKKVPTFRRKIVLLNQLICLISSQKLVRQSLQDISWLVKISKRSAKLRLRQAALRGAVYQLKSPKFVQYRRFETVFSALKLIYCVSIFFCGIRVNKRKTLKTSLSLRPLLPLLPCSLIAKLNAK